MGEIRELRSSERIETSLSSEVHVAWNGPTMYDPVTSDLIGDSLKEYFEEHTKSGAPRFHTSSKLRFSSSTVSDYMNKKSRIACNG